MWFLCEFLCESCGQVHESLEKRSAIPGAIDCPCGSKAERCISAPKVKTPLITVATGKSDPPPPHVLDTRPLAEGQSYSKFKAERRKYHRDRTYAKVKQLVA